MTKNKYYSTGFWEKVVGLIVMVAGAYLILVGFFPVIIIGLCIYLKGVEHAIVHRIHKRITAEKHKAVSKESKQEDQC